MKEKAIEIGKSTSQYFLTALFAAIGVYVGIKVSLAEINVNIMWLKEDVREMKHVDEIQNGSIFDLQKDNYFIKGKLGITDIRGENKSEGKQ